mmetsp:Transcript_22009/g.31624  ORF Transcript_22009/g.31624 Transcript_22009/m.31624 type:complete len:164 (-) Transcript_22009:266-757(-)
MDSVAVTSVTDGDLSLSVSRSGEVVDTAERTSNACTNLSFSSSSASFDNTFPQPPPPSQLIQISANSNPPPHQPYSSIDMVDSVSMVKQLTACIVSQQQTIANLQAQLLNEQQWSRHWEIRARELDSAIELYRRQTGSTSDMKLLEEISSLKMKLKSLQKSPK